MDLNEIRKTVIVALFSDDLLLEMLVLKGGNALSLVYGFGSRSSIDVDLSIQGDFPNLSEAKRRLFAALRDQFGKAGYILFDEKLVSRPSSIKPEQGEEWGGYEIDFKIIDEKTFKELRGNLDSIRRNATVVSPFQKRIFTIQISKFEFCGARAKRTIEGCTIYVYTPPMIALEKLRALCQQMPQYGPLRHRRPRARGFYDIYCVLTEGAVNLGTDANLELARAIFAAKNVPLSLIPTLANYREFHRQDWPSVQDSVSGTFQEFDFYFDFVLEEAGRLKSLWVE
jgi:hypothetical protein